MSEKEKFFDYMEHVCYYGGIYETYIYVDKKIAATFDHNRIIL